MKEPRLYVLNRNAASEILQWPCLVLPHIEPHFRLSTVDAADEKPSDLSDQSVTGGGLKNRTWLRPSESGSNQGPLRVPENSLGSEMGCQCRGFSVSYDLQIPFHGDVIEGRSAGPNCGRNHA